MLLVNLPVRDLSAARSFYQDLGFDINAESSSGVTTAIAVSDDVTVMLHTRKRFADLTRGAVGSPFQTRAFHSLTTTSREAVDDLLAAALRAGADHWNPPRSDGYRHSGSFSDPDGHLWQVMYTEVVPVNYHPSVGEPPNDPTFCSTSNR